MLVYLLNILQKLIKEWTVREIETERKRESERVSKKLVGRLIVASKNISLT